jgi:predicted nucleic acid-binding protein
MNVVLHIPDDFAERLGADGDVERLALEGPALESFRAGRLTKADLLLMDDQAGVAVARRKGLAATGTLGVLDAAARQSLFDLAKSFARLKTTSFHYRQGLLDSLLARRQDKS